MTAAANKFERPNVSAIAEEELQAADNDVWGGEVFRFPENPSNTIQSNRVPEKKRAQLSLCRPKAQTNVAKHPTEENDAQATIRVGSCAATASAPGYIAFKKRPSCEW
jgi:hypothetical protein